MQSKKKYCFTATVESVSLNLVNTAVFLPHHINIELPRGRLRANGSINGAPFSSAILYRKDAGRFFSISLLLRKEAGIEPGDVVPVIFKLVDAKKIELPDELETIPFEEEKGRKIWKKFPSKIQHVLSQYVESAKKIDSRVKKSMETIQKARAGSLTRQSKRKNT